MKGSVVYQSAKSKSHFLSWISRLTSSEESDCSVTSICRFRLRHSSADAILEHTLVGPEISLPPKTRRNEKRKKEPVVDVLHTRTFGSYGQNSHSGPNCTLHLSDSEFLIKVQQGPEVHRFCIRDLNLVYDKKTMSDEVEECKMATI
ncbi:hypothetical protein R1flu_015324 [Riccia fluitans]|uniref:Uncharacterized protein n=1 Tax=Riccia fluitans TaxID=41844 RepID=A0ABD1YJ11_9MARC